MHQHAKSLISLAEFKERHFPLGSTKARTDRLVSTVLCKINTLALLLVHLHWYTRGRDAGVRLSPSRTSQRRHLLPSSPGRWRGIAAIGKRVFRSEHHRKDARRFPRIGRIWGAGFKPPVVVVELPLSSPGPGFIC